MRISPTGSNIPRGSNGAGFTLIEVLVVLTILAIVAITVMPSISSPDQRITMQREGQKLYDFIQLASEEAQFSGQQWGLAITPKGYIFSRYSENEKAWVQGENNALTQHNLPEGFYINVFMEEEQLSLLPKSESTPDIQFLSSGEMTAFILRMASADNTAHMSIQSDGINITVHNDEE